MNNDDFWGDKVEYVERLAGEVADLKGVLQDISQQVRRIERRIDLILPEGKRTKKRKTTASGDNRSMKTPALNETEARKTIEELKENLYKGKSIKSELRDMTVKHGLIPIARELGMTNKALPPKTELMTRIIARLQQSVMLTENIRKMPRVAEEKKNFGEQSNANR